MDTGTIALSAKPMGSNSHEMGSTATRDVSRRTETAAELGGAPKAAHESPPPQKVREQAESLGKALTSLNRGIHFEIDESTDRVVTKIIDKETNEVIRQIPPEEVLEISQRLRTYMGVLLDIEV